MTDELPIDSNDDQWLYTGEKYRVRHLRPGDGFVCAKAAKQRVIPCAAPVAFAEISGSRRPLRGPDIAWQQTHALCGRHLLDLLLPDRRTANQQPKYRATQALVDAHHAEFESLCVHFQNVIAAEALEHVPAEVRTLIEGDVKEASE